MSALNYSVTMTAREDGLIRLAILAANLPDARDLGRSIANTYGGDRYIFDIWEHPGYAFFEEVRNDREVTWIEEITIDG